MDNRDDMVFDEDEHTDLIRVNGRNGSYTLPTAGPARTYALGGTVQDVPVEREVDSAHVDGPCGEPGCGECDV